VGQATAMSDAGRLPEALDWLQVFSHLHRNRPKKSRDLRTPGQEEEEIGDLLNLWKIWVRDLVVLKVRGEKAGEGLINHDLLPEAEKDAARFSFERLEGIFALISEIQRSLPSMSTSSLALENLDAGDPEGDQGGTSMKWKV